MEFVTLYIFRITAVLRVLHETGFGPPFVTFLDAGYPVISVTKDTWWMAFLIHSRYGFLSSSISTQRQLSECQAKLFLTSIALTGVRQVGIHLTVTIVSLTNPVGALAWLTFDTVFLALCRPCDGWVPTSSNNLFRVNWPRSSHFQSNWLTILEGQETGELLGYGSCRTWKSASSIG